jgi:glycosyltransferase involved in cell wall biosynthesis
MELSIVLPCLNEEANLAAAIEELRAGISGSISGEYEFVVADNRSTDNSAEIARKAGAVVVGVAERGYGAAILGGVRASRGTMILFVDCDGTYCYEDAGLIVAAASGQPESIAIANRFGAKLERGAMPFLHRWVGTPLLSTMIRLLFGGRRVDCNSGFRCMHRTWFDSLAPRCRGMEFATELIINTRKLGGEIVEIGSGLRVPPHPREAHLKTWRDGMRHLLFILSRRPALFELLGLSLALFASTLQILAMLIGETRVGEAVILGEHSQLLFLLAAVCGVQLYLFSCALYQQLPEERPSPPTRFLMKLPEANVLAVLFGAIIAGLALLGVLLLHWYRAGMSGIDELRGSIAISHGLALVAMLGTGLLILNVVRQAIDNQ